MKVVFVFLCLMIAVIRPTFAQQEYTAAQLDYFESHIRPAFVKYCYDCHSADAGSSRGGLLLDTRQGLLQGGDSGPALVPGDPTESLIWEAINWDGYEMPPSQKMPSEVIAKFKIWIEMGAPDPRQREQREFRTKITDHDVQNARETHWAFQQPQLPTTGQSALSNGTASSVSIDSLIDEKLKTAGLTAAPPADAYTLLRRINYDLVGLPPTPDEIRAFVSAYQKNSDKAVSKKIDELLGREQYGERWGRHWLDVARYAESSGSRNTPYPHAWRYRNYVIDAFNKNTPYDRFIKEQLAGDLLPAKTDEEWNNNLLATGFLAVGMKHHDQKNPRQFQSDLVDEQLDTTTQAVLGLTVACARCHDHKYDPVPIDDYYRLAGIFYSTKTYYGTTRIAQNHRPSDLLLLPVQDQLTSGPRNGRGRNLSREQLENQIANLDRQFRQAANGKDKRNIRNQRNRFATQLAALNPDGSQKAFAMGVQENGEMLNASVLIGGEIEKPAQEVQRGFVRVLGDLDFTVTSDQSSGRMQLVEALTSQSNPLTARVMMNRVWMHLLGKPIVETTTNFGLAGAEPSHQQLLDYLAVRFMQKGWDIQEMIREIMMSDAYRRSAQYVAANYEIDPDNKLHWRMNSQTLDAEALRDSLLALSGRLDLSRPQGSSRTGRARRGASQAAATFRSVYLPIDRDNIPESLALFDFADPSIPSAGRAESIVPTQALFLMNGDLAMTSAAAMADLLKRNIADQNEQVRTAFLWAYSRPPTSEELAVAAAFFKDFRFAESEASSNIDIRPRLRSSADRDRGDSGQTVPRGRRGARRSNANRRGVGRQDAENQRDVGSQAVAATDPLAVFCQALLASARFRILN